MAKTVTRQHPATAVIEERYQCCLGRHERAGGTNYQHQIVASPRALIATLLLFAAFSDGTARAGCRLEHNASPPTGLQRCGGSTAASRRGTDWRSATTAANSALCSAIGSHFPNPPAAVSSALSYRSVMSSATFAASEAARIFAWWRHPDAERIRGATCHRHPRVVRFPTPRSNATNAASSVTSRESRGGAVYFCFRICPEVGAVALAGRRRLRAE